jgi:RNA polymerase sigma-70 factor (ECF subfamily)
MKDNRYWSDCWNAFRKGDEEKFRLLHDGFFHLLHDYALRLLQDHDLAYDAIQDLFMKLWIRRGSLPEVQFVKAYLLRSLRTTILNKLRSLKLYELNISLQSSAPDIEFSPEEIKIKEESELLNARQLTKMINELPPAQKHIIYLRFYEGMSYKEISEVVNMNYQSLINTTNRILNRVKVALRNHPEFLLVFLFLPHLA